TKRAAIDRMVGIAFDVDHLRDGVLSPVAERVDDHTAADRTVGARAARLGCALNLERLRLRVGGSDIESERRQARSSDDGGLDERSSGDVHEQPPNLGNAVDALDDTLQRAIIA